MWVFGNKLTSIFVEFKVFPAAYIKLYTRIQERVSVLMKWWMLISLQIQGNLVCSVHPHRYSATPEDISSAKDLFLIGL